MSLELHIFLKNSHVPTLEAWQQAIERLRFPTVLDTTLDVQRHAGFSPATYAGKPTGFEFYLEPAEDLLVAYDHIAERVGPRDACATFRWSSDMTEMCAAVSAAAALAKIADGIYFYPDDDIVYNPDEAIKATRKDLSAV